MKFSLIPLSMLVLVVAVSPMATAQSLGVGPVQKAPAAAPLATKNTNDIIFRLSGAVQSGKILSVDAQSIRIEVSVMPGQPPGQVAVPRADVVRVEFAPNPEAEALLREADLGSLSKIDGAWLRKAAALSLEGSTAGDFGLKVADLLLQTGKNEDRQRALQLFSLIEREDWSADRQSRARGGRLKAMVLLGRASEAIAEAKSVLEATDDPSILIESHFVLGEAAFAALQKLAEENPRWQEDIFVRPDYDRYLNEALDHYFYAYLFHGSNETAATRGLEGSIKVWLFHKAEDQAKQLAGDLVALYPGSPLAAHYQSMALPKDSLNPTPTDEN